MKVLCKAFAFLSLGLGVVGMFLPVLPTTPFLLLSAYLFSKSSGRYYEWLLSHKWFGTYIRQFSEARSIPLRIKIVSISMLWTTILNTLATPAASFGGSRRYFPYFEFRYPAIVFSIKAG